MNAPLAMPTAPPQPGGISRTIQRWRLTLVLAAAVLALSACGGGGGGDGGNRPESGPVPCAGVATAAGQCLTAAQFESRRDARARGYLRNREYREQPALERTNTHEAHAALAVVLGEALEPGDGVTIAVVDSGVDLDHPELAGADITGTLLQGVPDEVAGRFPTGELSHGTAVASVIAAQPNGTGFVGVAPGAEIRVYAVPLDDRPDAVPIGDFEPRISAQSFTTVLADNPDIVNASFGAPGTFVGNYTTAEIRQYLDQNRDYADVVAAIAQAEVDAADRTIFVWAAGNDHGEACDPTRSGVENCVPDSSSPMGGRYEATSPGLIYGGAVALLEEWQGHNVAVVALGADGRIAEFSNRCGVAAPWCISAPGTGISVAYFGADGRGVAAADGTSFATPMVSGGLALMKQFFRGQLSNPELVDRLFRTADRTGVYGDDAIYGQGSMDLGAAMTPVGTATVTTGRGGAAVVHDMRTTALRPGGALGDGLSRSLAGREIAAFDALGAPFWFDLSDLAGDAGARPLADRLRALLRSDGFDDRPAGRDGRFFGAPTESAAGPTGWRFGLHESPARSEGSLFDLARDVAALTLTTAGGFEARAFTSASPAGERTPALGVTLAWRPPDRPFGLRLGWLDERESLLGSTAEGAFGRLSSASIVTGLEGSAGLEGWRLAADIEVGAAIPRAEGGIVTGLSQATTSAVTLRATRRLSDRDAITLSLSQPPRIERGTARFTLPVGRTREGAVVHETIRADLRPSARQVDLAARWRRSPVLGGELLAEGLVSHHPGHASGDPELGLLMGWRAAF